MARLHEHITEADGAVQETRAAMAEFKKAAKNTNVSATKFNDLVDRVDDTTLGRRPHSQESPVTHPQAGLIYIDVSSGVG